MKEITIGSAFADLLNASSDEERKKASKKLVDAQDALQKKLASQGIKITFSSQKEKK